MHLFASRIAPNFIAGYSIQDSMDNEQDPVLHPAQKEGIKFAMMTCILLENHIARLYDNGIKMIESAHRQSERLYAKLYPAHSPRS